MPLDADDGTDLVVSRKEVDVLAPAPAGWLDFRGSGEPPWSVPSTCSMALGRSALSPGATPAGSESIAARKSASVSSAPSSA